MNDLLIVKDLKKYFIKKGSRGKKEITQVADGISFEIKHAETLVLAGESGSGKTSIARIILRALEPDSGHIIFDDQEITNSPDSLQKIRLECQMVHQDPYASINPRMTVLDIIKEPLEIHQKANKEERNQIALQALKQVKLEPAEEIAQKYPHMLSGGQRQRVAIARAIVTNPKLVIADEPVSMLDVSVRIGILELIKELQQKHEISFLYITHDLSTAGYIGHRIAILYRGQIVETGPIRDVLSTPLHPYTQALLDSISNPDPNNLHTEKKIRINEQTKNSQQGCRFRDRCPYAIEKCAQEPKLEAISKERHVACFVKIN